MSIKTTEQPPGSPVRITGDARFVPAPHNLVADRQVGHAAFRLWCLLHRLWFLREPPTMELLQELMGHRREAQAPWQAATRRSVERWLAELEQAGWLVWTRRGETTRRYHLCSAGSGAADTTLLRELRMLLNSGKATLAEVQTLLEQGGAEDDATAESHEGDSALPVATAESHGATAESHEGDSALPVATAESHGATAESHDATAESHEGDSALPVATAESHDATAESHDATAESHDATAESYGATAESHDATIESYAEAAQGVLMRQKNGLRHEIRKIIDLDSEITPPPPAASVDGGDGGPTATEHYLLREGFSVKAAREFRHLEYATVQRELERRRELGQGIGAIVTTWRVQPPLKPTPVAPAAPANDQHARSAKEHALALAPADANELEIQYLALDLEDKLTPEAALAKLRARRTALREGCSE